MAWGALLFALLVATGAGFRLGYERHVLNFRKHDPDRLIWLALAAAFFLSLVAWPVYELYDYVRPFPTGEHRHPHPIAWVSFPVAVALPLLTGNMVGRFRLRWFSDQPKSWQREREHRPTGFDFVMQGSPSGKGPFLYIELKEVAGEKEAGGKRVVIGRPRHASPTPYPQDVYIEPLYFDGLEKDIDMEKARHQEWTPTGGGVLVRADDILITRVYPIPDKEENPNVQDVEEEPLQEA